MFRISTFNPRRIGAGGTMLGAVALVGAALHASQALSQDQLGVMTYGGIFTEAESNAYYKPFTEATGIEIVPVTPVSLAKIKAAVTLGTYDVDVSSIPENDYYQAVAEGLLESIDYSIVDKSIGPNELFEQFGVQSSTISYQLVYNSDRFPNGGPQSWADFWDVEKFPGSRALWNTPVGSIEYALLADGVAKEDLYPLDAAKVERALAKLDELKPHIKVWWEQGAQSQQRFEAGEVDLMRMWNGRASDPAKQGAPVAQVWNEAGIVTNRWIVPKGTPHKDIAMRFINSNIDPAKQAVFAKALVYGSMNPAMLDHLSAEERASQPTSPEHLEAGFRIDAEWWGSNMAEILPMWQSWQLK